MTYAEITLAALKTLAADSTKKLFHASDVMWQIRRDGWQISTDKARRILKHLASTGQIQKVMDGRRYYFRPVK